MTLKQTWDEALLDLVRPKGQIIPYEEDNKEAAITASHLLNYWLDKEAKPLITPVKETLINSLLAEMPKKRVVVPEWGNELITEGYNQCRTDVIRILEGLKDE